MYIRVNIFSFGSLIMLFLMVYLLYIWIGLQHILVGFKNYVLFLSIIPRCWTSPHRLSEKPTAGSAYGFPEKKKMELGRGSFPLENRDHIYNVNPGLINPYSDY